VKGYIEMVVVERFQQETGAEVESKETPAYCGKIEVLEVREARRSELGVYFVYS